MTSDSNSIGKTIRKAALRWIHEGKKMGGWNTFHGRMLVAGMMEKREKGEREEGDTQQEGNSWVIRWKVIHISRMNT
jgi:hypothetical protein